MKKLLYLVALPIIGIACQHSAPATESKTVTPSKVAMDSIPQVVAKVEPLLPSLFTAADTLSPPMRDLLARYDLSGLWQNADDMSSKQRPVFEGFFGPDHYRFRMALTTVKRDPENPAVYQVAGKCRYRKNIRPFTGTITVRQIRDLNYPGFLPSRAIISEEAADSINGQTYTARAQLQLEEENTENSGVFEGEIVLDFYVVPGKKPDYVSLYDREGYDDRLPTRGGHLMIRGSRRNISTGQVKSFLVAPYVASIAPQIFKDFMLDERMGQINPKYIKLGWSNYWENDEWWAKSPKPSLNL